MACHNRQRGENYNPFAFGMRPITPKPPHMMDYAMRGIYDTGMIATYGLVTAGTIGMVGSLLHR